MTLSYKQARARVERNLKIQQVLATSGETEVLNIPSLMGPTGVGKTSMGRDLAAEFGLPYFCINTGENSDPTDVTGVPVPLFIREMMRSDIEENRIEGKLQYMQWVLNKYAAHACDQGVFLHFDDIDKAPRQIQGAMLSIFGNRMFRDSAVHPHTLFMASGNRAGADDVLANSMSESLRTRITIIEMVPTLDDLRAYNNRTNRIHPVVMGFLNHKTDYVYQHMGDANRYPTPRGWREVSVHFEWYSDPYEDVFGDKTNNNWHQIVSEKCGEGVGKDFWAWYRVLRQIDVERILRTGKLDQAITLDSKKVDDRLMHYAAVFALAHYLNNHGVQKTHVGLEVLFSDDNTNALHEDLRIALATQLKREVRGQMSKLFKKAVDAIVASIITIEE